MCKNLHKNLLTITERNLKNKNKGKIISYSWNMKTQYLKDVSSSEIFV